MTTNQRARFFLLTALKSCFTLFLFSFAYQIVTFLIIYLSNFTMVSWEVRQTVCLALGLVVTFLLYFVISKGESVRLAVKQKYEPLLVMLAHGMGHLLFILASLIFIAYPLDSTATVILWAFGVAFLPILWTENIFFGTLIVTVPLLLVKIFGLWFGHYRILKEKPYLKEETSEPAERLKGSWRDTVGR